MCDFADNKIATPDLTPNPTTDPTPVTISNPIIFNQPTLPQNVVIIPIPTAPISCAICEEMNRYTGICEKVSNYSNCR